MSALLLAQFWMLGVGRLARKRLRGRAGPASWLALILAAVLPTLVALVLVIRPGTAATLVATLDLPPALPLPAVTAPAALPELPWTALYLGAAALLFGRTLWRLGRLHRLARRGERVAPDLVLCLETLPPLALGWPARTVLVSAPLWSAMTASERAMLLAHERSHLARRDPELTLALLALQNLFWINPGCTALVSGWRQAVEVRADRAATRRHAPPDYARLLARLMRETTQTAHPVPTATPTQLKGDATMRLNAILNPDDGRRTPAAALALALGGAVALCLGTAAWAAPTGAEPEVVKRVPPMMPANCPGLVLPEKVEIMADRVTQADGEPPKLYGKATILVGEVTLRFDVGEDGAPRNVVVTDANADCFHAPSLAAVRQWRFAPGQGASGVENMLRFVLSVEDGTDPKTSIAAFSGD